MEELEEALARVAETIRTRGPVPDDVIVGLERLRSTVVSWLSNKEGTLYAPDHGRWIVTPNGASVDLARRSTWRRLMKALVDRRIANPGESISAAELVTIGWPDEPSSSASANRLRVSLHRLRRCGLERVLVTTNEGWMLEPTIAVERTTAVRLRDLVRT